MVTEKNLNDKNITIDLDYYRNLTQNLIALVSRAICVFWSRHICLIRFSVQWCKLTVLKWSNSPIWKLNLSVLCWYTTLCNYRDAMTVLSSGPRRLAHGQTSIRTMCTSRPNAFSCWASTTGLLSWSSTTNMNRHISSVTFCWWSAYSPPRTSTSAGTSWTPWTRSAFTTARFRSTKRLRIATTCWHRSATWRVRSSRRWIRTHWPLIATSLRYVIPFIVTRRWTASLNTRCSSHGRVCMLVDVNQQQEYVIAFISFQNKRF